MTITYLCTLVVVKVKKCANYKKQCTLFSFDVNHNHTASTKISPSKSPGTVIGWKSVTEFGVNVFTSYR